MRFGIVGSLDRNDLESVSNAIGQLGKKYEYALRCDATNAPATHVDYKALETCRLIGAKVSLYNVNLEGSTNGVSDDKFICSRLRERDMRLITEVDAILAFPSFNIYKGKYKKMVYTGKFTTGAEWKVHVHVVGDMQMILTNPK